MSAQVKVSPTGDYSQAARRLVTQPGEWLRINRFDAASRALAFARSITEGRVEGFHDIGFEVQIEVRGCDVYARYFGSARLAMREATS